MSGFLSDNLQKLQNRAARVIIKVIPLKLFYYQTFFEN